MHTGSSKQLYPDEPAFLAACQNGEINEEMLYWHKGMSGWKQVPKQPKPEVHQEPVAGQPGPRRKWRIWVAGAIALLLTLGPALESSSPILRILDYLLVFGLAVLVLLLIDWLRRSKPRPKKQ